MIIIIVIGKSDILRQGRVGGRGEVAHGQMQSRGGVKGGAQPNAEQRKPSHTSFPYPHPASSWAGGTCVAVQDGAWWHSVPTHLHVPPRAFWYIYPWLATPVLRSFSL